MPEPPLDAAGSISIVEGAVDIVLDEEAGELGLLAAARPRLCSATRWIDEFNTAKR